MWTAADGPNASQQPTRRRVLAGGAAAALTAVAGCASTMPFVGQRFEESETVPVDGTEAVIVSTRTGSVTVPSSLPVESVETSAGAVDVAGTTGDLSASTSTGAIEIRDIDGSVTALAPDLDAELRASTSTGDITIESPGLDAERRDEDLVVGALGEGGPGLDVETTTGSVTLERLN
jgi:DUF4097 and DUF4098 domain-containing protein YvlB